MFWLHCGMEDKGDTVGQPRLQVSKGLVCQNGSSDAGVNFPTIPEGQSEQAALMAGGSGCNGDKLASLSFFSFFFSFKVTFNAIDRIPECLERSFFFYFLKSLAVILGNGVGTLASVPLLTFFRSILGSCHRY